MSDIYSNNKRSEIMSKISGRETKPEIFIRKFLFSKGFRYKKNVEDLPGRPDIVIPKYKKVIFVHGCFWHGHTCKDGKLPLTRKDFWDKKIKSTIQRDKENSLNLESKKWEVITIWSCELKNKTQQEITLKKLLNKLELKS